MKKINIFQVLNLINMGMALVESIKGKKSKQEKIDAAVEAASPFVQALELSFGKDLLKEEKVKPFAEKYISAAKDLVNIIAEVKGLKADKPADTPVEA